MNELDHHALAALVGAYALFEFLLRRLLPSYLRLPPSDVPRAAVVAGVHSVTLVFCTAGILSVSLLAGYALLALITFVHELLETRNGQSSRALEWFIAKQLLSGIVVFGVWYVSHPFTSFDWYTRLEDTVLAALGTPKSDMHEQRRAFLVLLAAYLFVIDGGTRIVRGIFRKFPTLYANVVQKLSKPARRESEENVGEWIGVLERLITLTFVLTGSFTALAFALTAKSIARFKELEDKDFAEYYLLGTSASLLVAMFAGIFVRIILKI